MVSLETLPVEIVLAIVKLLCPHCTVPHPGIGKLLCPHCTVPHPGIGNPIRYSRELHLSLAKLSTTSKALRRIAYPVLLHSLFPKGPTPCQSLVSFLLEQPELGAQAKQMHIIGWRTEDFVLDNPEDLEWEMLDRLHRPFARVGDSKSAMWSPGQRLLQLYNQSKKPSYSWRSLVSRFISLALSCTPNIERLVLEDPELRLFLRPLSLPSLRSVEIYYGIEVFGLDLEYHRNLIEAAPSLTHLECSQLTHVSSIPPLHTLTELSIFESLLETDSFFNLMRGLPVLKRFTFHSADPRFDRHVDEASGSEVTSAIELTCKTLEFLQLNFCEAYIDDDEDGGGTVQ